MSALKFNILSYDLKLSKDSSMVVLPSVDGHMGIIENSGNKVIELDLDFITVFSVDKAKISYFIVTSGYAHVTSNEIFIFTESIFDLSDKVTVKALQNKESILVNFSNEDDDSKKKQLAHNLQELTNYVLHDRPYQ